MQALALFDKGSGPQNVRTRVEAAQQFYDTFDDCEVANTAAQAILNEIALCDMVWTAQEGSSTVIDSAIWTTFVQQALTQMLVAGFVVWKKIQPREGSTAARVLQPQEYTAHYDSHYHLTIDCVEESQYRKKVHVNCLYAPNFVTGGITAPAKRAFDLSKRYKTLIRLYEKRNEINSEPSVFTTVSRDIGAGQDTTTWFSPRNRAGIHDRDFNALVAQRQRAITELSNITKRRRVEETGHGEMRHTEYIVSDGQQPVEMSALLGQGDERAFRDQTAHAILKCYNVDPQVLGQNVNSERAGLGLGSSSHAMTTRAINNFDAMVDRYIAFLNTVMKEASRTPGGAAIELKRPVKESVVQKCAMLLEPEALVAQYARIYKLNPADFSIERIRGMQAPDRKQKRTTIEQEQQAQES
jgi:hypothetical protein